MTEQAQKIPTDQASSRRATGEARRRIRTLTRARVELWKQQLVLVQTDRVGQYRTTMRVLRDIATEALGLHEELATFLVYEYNGSVSSRPGSGLEDYGELGSVPASSGIMEDSFGMDPFVAQSRNRNRRKPGLGKVHLALRSALQALIQVEADLFCPDDSEGYQIPNRETSGIMLMRELGTTLQGLANRQQASANNRPESVADLVEAYTRAKDSGLDPVILDGIQAKIKGALGGSPEGSLVLPTPAAYTETGPWSEANPSPGSDPTSTQT